MLSNNTGLKNKLTEIRAETQDSHDDMHLWQPLLPGLRAIRTRSRVFYVHVDSQDDVHDSLRGSVDRLDKSTIEVLREMQNLKEESPGQGSPNDAERIARDALEYARLSM